MAVNKFKRTVANPRFWVALPVVVGVYLPLLAVVVLADLATNACARIADILWDPVRLWMHKGVRRG